LFFKSNNIRNIFKYWGSQRFLFFLKSKLQQKFSFVVFENILAQLLVSNFSMKILKPMIIDKKLRESINK